MKSSRDRKRALGECVLLLENSCYNLVSTNEEKVILLDIIELRPNTNTVPFHMILKLSRTLYILRYYIGICRRFHTLLTCYVFLHHVPELSGVFCSLLLCSRASLECSVGSRDFRNVLEDTGSLTLVCRQTMDNYEN